MKNQEYKKHLTAVFETQDILRRSHHPALRKNGKPTNGLPVALEILSYLNIQTNSRLGRCNPSHETIADALGISEKTVERMLDELCHPETGIGLTSHKMAIPGKHNHLQYDWRGVHPDLPAPWKGNGYVKPAVSHPTFPVDEAKAEAVEIAKQPPVAESVPDWLSLLDLPESASPERKADNAAVKGALLSKPHTDTEARTQIALMKENRQLEGRFTEITQIFHEKDYKKLNMYGQIQRMNREDGVAPADPDAFGAGAI